MINFVDFFFEYVLQAYFLAIFILFGIFLILMMFLWIFTLSYIFLKRPDIRRRFFLFGFFPPLGFSINKEYFNDPYIKKYKKRTLFFLKAALATWLLLSLSIILIIAIALLLNFLFN